MGNKILGQKSYGSIPHLIGSKRGPTDKGVNEGQHRIATEKVRDFKDLIIVQEKLDGSNVAIARINDRLVPVTRTGYAALSSPYEQHHKFDEWAFLNLKRFEFLEEGERLCGEWLTKRHSIEYKLYHEPFVAFDIMSNGHERTIYAEFLYRCGESDIITPNLIHMGGPAKAKWVMKKMGLGNHGAQEKPEGAVWRIEREFRVDFLCKFVRHDYEPGKYL